MIKIVDYGMGNLRSVQKAFEKLGHEAVICDQTTQLGSADKLVLPGVGVFAMRFTSRPTRHDRADSRSHHCGQTVLGFAWGCIAVDATGRR
jgi:glutamine amidotransferase